MLVLLHILYYYYHVVLFLERNLGTFRGTCSHLRELLVVQGLVIIEKNLRLFQGNLQLFVQSFKTLSSRFNDHCSRMMIMLLQM